MSIKLTTTKQATKRATYELLSRLREGEELTTEEIDSMLLRFAPAQGSKVKPDDKMAWLAKAVAVQDVREYLKFIAVVDGQGYATNGHVIHKAEVNLPDGWYCPKTHKPVEMDAKPPRCDQLIDAAKHRAIFHEGITTADMSAVISDKKALVLEYGAPHPDNSDILLAVVHLNARYLKAATNGDVSEKFNVTDNGSGAMLASGSNALGTWLIAAMRV